MRLNKCRRTLYLPLLFIFSLCLLLPPFSLELTRPRSYFSRMNCSMSPLLLVGRWKFYARQRWRVNGEQSASLVRPKSRSYRRQVVLPQLFGAGIAPLCDAL